MIRNGDVWVLNELDHLSIRLLHSAALNHNNIVRFNHLSLLLLNSAFTDRLLITARDCGLILGGRSLSLGLPTPLLLLCILEELTHAHNVASELGV